MSISKDELTYLDELHNQIKDKDEIIESLNEVIKYEKMNRKVSTDYILEQKVEIDKLKRELSLLKKSN